MNRLMMALYLGLICVSAAQAQDAASFKDKTVTMLIATTPGGGTDSSARLIASVIGRYLPDKPPIVPKNVPGGSGVIAMNYFVQQAARDGLTIAMGAASQSDPQHYRKPQSHYDPTTFNIIGGVGRGGTVLVIRKDAEKRLRDKSLPPVIMGSIGGVPRSGQLMAAWGIGFLDWNAKWVIGYRGTNDLFIALERGEIDMTSTSNISQIAKLLDAGTVSLLVQSGSLEADGKWAGRPEFRNAPLLTDLMQGRLADPLAKQAFDHGTSIITIDKWVALPPGTPEAIVRVYREAYLKATQDAEFAEKGRAISENLEPMSWQAVTALLKTLGTTPPEALTYMNGVLRKQGLDVE